MDTNLNRLCRLCLQTSDESVNVFENFEDSTIASILSQHFWFEVQRNDGLTEYLCQVCWTSTKEFHNFYRKVELIQNGYDGCWKSNSSVGNVSDVSEETAGAETICPSDLIKQDISESPLQTHLNIVKCEEAELLEANDVRMSQKQSSNDEDSNSCDQSENGSQTSDEPPQPSKKVRKINDVNDGIVLKTDKPKRKNKYEILKSIRQSEKDKVAAQIREYFTMKCDMCTDEVKFDTFSDARKHYRNVHRLTKGHLVCCDKKFFCRSYILDHIQYHLNPDSFRCDPCGKRFNDRKGLKYHIEGHELMEVRAFKCSLCEKSFGKASTLKAHVKARHSSKPGETFPCDHDECGKVFRSEFSLTTHVRNVHESTLAFVCEICAKGFKSKSRLGYHMNWNHSTTAQPKEQCNICGTWLKNKASLLKHVVRHEEEYLNCPICNKRVPNKPSLTSHIKNSHGEKRMQCTYLGCNKVFMRLQSLKEHMAIHTGEDLYDCSYCDKKFKSAANMYSHRKKVHFTEWSREPKKRVLIERTSSKLGK